MGHVAYLKEEHQSHKMNNRIQWLDALRGVASVGVVYFHLNEGIPDHNSVYLKIIGFGWIGVPVFFFISGYCISIIVKKPISTLEFVVKRFF
ncbi:MAG: acyltransferase [Saprospirales bacterium]|nr:acyltransferase [Saprospirales bacterium]